MKTLIAVTAWTSIAFIVGWFVFVAIVGVTDFYKAIKERN